MHKNISFTLGFLLSLGWTFEGIAESKTSRLSQIAKDDPTSTAILTGSGVLLGTVGGITIGHQWNKGDHEKEILNDFHYATQVDDIVKDKFPTAKIYKKDDNNKNSQDPYKALENELKSQKQLVETLETKKR